MAYIMILFFSTHPYSKASSFSTRPMSMLLKDAPLEKVDVEGRRRSSGVILHTPLHNDVGEVGGFGGPLPICGDGLTM